MQIPSHCQTIAGRAYDTTEAELIGWIYDNSIIDSDYEGIKRHLMRHQDGHYFLFSLFGTMTSRPFGQIVPLSEQDARQWSAKNGINLAKVRSIGTVSASITPLLASELSSVAQ